MTREEVLDQLVRTAAYAAALPVKASKAGKAARTGGRLRMDNPRSYPWISITACVIEAGIPGEEADFSIPCPRHPERDNPAPRVPITRMTFYTASQEGFLQATVCYLGQCADCGRIYWAYETPVLVEETDKFLNSDNFR